MRLFLLVVLFAVIAAVFCGDSKSSESNEVAAAEGSGVEAPLSKVILKNVLSTEGSGEVEGSGVVFEMKAAPVEGSGSDKESAESAEASGAEDDGKFFL